MFSGIIQTVGKVASLDMESRDAAVLSIKKSIFFQKSKLGDSVAINGVCLTIAAFDEHLVKFDLASETIRRTSLYNLVSDSEVNLEHSLKLGDSLDGHLVSGHIDGVLTVRERLLEGASWKFIFEFDTSFYKYLAPKGSLAIDGVSLTIGEVGPDYLSVYIIPHTFNHTIFRNYSIGSIANLEIDSLARYVVHFMESKQL